MYADWHEAATPPADSTINVKCYASRFRCNDGLCWCRRSATVSRCSYGGRTRSVTQKVTTERASRHPGLRAGQMVNVAPESAALLVKPDVARRQMDAEVPAVTLGEGDEVSRDEGRGRLPSPLSQPETQGGSRRLAHVDFMGPSCSTPLEWAETRAALRTK
jgi:hypothetical protein